MRYDVDIECLNTMKDVRNYMAIKSKEYGGRNIFLSSDEYKKIYPEILGIYAKEKTDLKIEAKKELSEANIKYGDRVFYDVLLPFFNVEKLEGILVEKEGLPYVKLNKPTSNGKKSVRWHKGFRPLIKTS